MLNMPCYNTNIKQRFEALHLATRKDVATKAGVSQATVTNVYNQSKYVSPDIRKRVFEAAKEVGYMQDAPMEFVFLCDDPSNPHNLEIFEGMVSSASEQGTLVSMIPFSNNLESICNKLINNHISGVFISNSYHSVPENLLKKLEQNGIVVSSSWIDFQVNFETVPSVIVDYLVSIGHKKICYLSNKSLSECKPTVFETAMQKNGLSFSKDSIIPGIFPYKADLFNGYSATKNALIENKRFTAIVAVNDLMAMGAIRAIIESGLSVPDDISVVSCDDIPFAEFCTPPLTTVRLPAKSLGKTCMSNMILRKKGETPSVSHANINIIVRNSSAPPKKK